MKKGWKIALGCLVAAVPVGLIVGLCIPNNNIQHITAVGSSGVKPFVETLSSEYMKTSTGNKYDITVDAGGSGFGIGQVAKGFSNIGDASKNPFESVKSEYKEFWKKQNIKTVTIGWEAICIVYIPPKGLSSSTKKQINKLLTLNERNIANLYRTFSGYKAGLEMERPKLGLFLNNDIEIDSADKEKLNNQSVIPYVRSGGSLTSGTAASFFEGSHYDNAHTDLTDEQKSAFTNGNYGNDWRVYDTDEANSRAWDIFNRNNIAGSMVYLSSGFVKSNKSLIMSCGYGIVSYGGVEFSVKKIKTTGGFNFYRPLNVMLSCDDTRSREFIDYLISEKTADQWESLGAKQVDEDDIDSMTSNDKLWCSDIELSKARYALDESQIWEKDDIVFGAEDRYAEQ